MCSICAKRTCATPAACLLLKPHYLRRLERERRARRQREIIEETSGVGARVPSMERADVTAERRARALRGHAGRRA